VLEREERIREWRDFHTFLSFYRLTNESSAVLNKAASLYQWHEPGWPHDLAFYVGSNKQWLSSNTQNREAYIYSETIPIEIVRAGLPDINIAFEKPTIAIDGQNIHTLEEFYEEVGNKIVPGATWGHNLDAFNDILCGGFGTPEEGFVLLWQNSQLSRKRLGYDETVRQLEIRKRHSRPSNIPQIDQEIARAKQNEGVTIFDWLVEIIEGHEIIDLVFD
jgi:RNAse (barnase) inhibitor barstar